MSNLRRCQGVPGFVPRPWSLWAGAVYPNSPRHFGERRFTSQRGLVGWRRIDRGRMDAANGGKLKWADR